MDLENEKALKYTHARIYSLITLLLASLIGFGVALYNIQIVHGEDYLERSVRTITLRETVNASRGNLTDRNGQMLVSNRSSYTLTFDASLLRKDEDANEAILRLLQLCQSQGVVWSDNLPVSTTQPFTYTLDSVADKQQRGRFLTYLQDKDGKYSLVSDSLEAEFLTGEYLDNIGLSAEKLIAGMRERFKLADTFTDAEARLILGVQYELALRKVMNIDAYVLAKDIDNTMISLLADGNYRGAKVGSASVREYQTDRAAHILGYMGLIEAEELPALKEQGYNGNEWIGKEGAEKAFEPYLRGIDGTRVVSTNSEGKVTSELYTKEPQPGNNVALTIDLDFQSRVEDTLAETINNMTAKDGIARGAGAAVIQVGTGEVLALASYPTYHLATFRQDFTALSADPAQPLFNRATQGTYAPGSTLKPLTAIAALEEGVVTTTQKIRDTGKWTYPGDSKSYLYCWNRGGHGLVNVTQAITVSCNYFFAEMGYRLGLDRLNQYVQAFGLGESTGIEISEKTGNLAENKEGENQAPWAAFGQASYLFTPLQLSNYIATLVSGGQHCNAHLLKTVKSYDNSKVLAVGDSTPQNIIDISPSSLKAVKEGMRNLTTTGSLASYFRSCVVSAGAKTGTAQITKKVKNNGVFVCFAPYDDPEIAVGIVIEKGGSGSALATMAVSILNDYFTADEVGAAILGEGTLLS